MPTYELSVIFRTMQRPELAQAVKRCCNNILERGGIIRQMENLGCRPLPFRMSCHGKREYEGNYILIHLDAPTSLPKELHEELKLDLDIINKNFFKNEKFVRPCLSGPCEFGELKDPYHEKRMWWSRVAKRYVRSDRKEKQKQA